MSLKTLERRLPYEIPQPADPATRRWTTMARIGAYVLLAAAMIAPIAQLGSKIVRNQRKLAAYQQKKQDGLLTAAELAAGPPKGRQGAVGRWRPAVHRLWEGRNIYESPEQHAERVAQTGESASDGEVILLHPNMPLTVILLTPFAYLPSPYGELLFSALKAVCVVLAALAAVRVISDGKRRPPDWVVGLGLAWWITLMISDLQHANTNGFVMAAIVAHLWLYRRGRDYSAGAMLALAVCLKMTPALFGLYWLYQRNWKLLAGCVVGGLLMAVVLPAGLLGPAHYVDLTQTWLDNLIFEGLGGAWYPVHVNQSWPAVASRFLLDGQPGGNILWNPDDNPYSAQIAIGEQWIAFASLSPATVKYIIQAGQFLIVALAAWAIGWRKLDRTDGRRGLHYGIVLCAILLLNQRTWAHHAAILLPASLAIWYAIAFGRMSRRARIAALTMTSLAGVILYGTMGELAKLYGRLAGVDKHAADDFADVLAAYGPDFAVFALLFASAVVLSVAMRRREPAYADRRQTLGQRDT